MDQMKAMQSRLRSLENRYQSRTEDSGDSSRFVRNALNVVHEPMIPASERAKEFRRRLRRIFEGRIGEARFTTTTFIADLDTSGAVDDLELWEKEVAALPEVKEVSIIPF
jgi:hypothetical protein